MKGTTGEVFSLVRENAPLPGCTVSEELWAAGEESVVCFSLAEDTDIGAELYGRHKLLIACGGAFEVLAPELGAAWTLEAGDGIVTPVDTPVGTATIRNTEKNEKSDTKAARGAVYMELSIRRRDDMSDAVKVGEVFKLGHLVPYQAGRIVNRDIVRSDRMKFVVMAFDAGTGLAEHAAPGEALVFALEGRAIIGYEGGEHAIEAGEQFKFAKNGRHWVKADGRFKMALLLTLE